MLARLAPLALVMLAACEPSGGAVTTPSAIAPGDLVRKAIASPGDGSDILEALAEFESAEAWRKAPAGLVISDRALEAMTSVPDQSRVIGKSDKRSNEDSADARAVRTSCAQPLQEEASTLLTPGAPR